MMYWHAFHHPYLLFWVEDYDERIETIQTKKPEHERVDRLKWFKQVEGKLPTELAEAFQTRAKATIEANQAYDKAYVEAGKALKKMYIKHLLAIEKFHAEECPDCSWDGHKLVFDER